MIVDTNSPTSELETLNFLKSNFERHYNTSKAPFGVHLTANTWFTSGPYRLEGYRRFLDYLATKDDVYVVPINKVSQRQLRTFRRTFLFCTINFRLRLTWRDWIGWKTLSRCRKCRIFSTVTLRCRRLSVNPFPVSTKEKLRWSESAIWKAACRVPPSIRGRATPLATLDRFRR